jgi:hypothetical protein
MGSGLRSLGDDQALQRRAGVLQQRLPGRQFAGTFDDGQAGAAVPGDVRDLFGGSGAVDGDRDGAQVGEGEVAQPVLGAVGHHHQDVVAALDTEGGVSRGEGGRLAARRAPGERGPAVACGGAPGQGGEVAVVLGVAQQQGGEREFRGVRGESQDRGHDGLQLRTLSQHW